MNETSGPQAAAGDDVIPVRAEEDFDRGRLADYLRGRLPGTERPLEVWQFGGGHANLTYLLRYGDIEYVLRRPPLGPVAKSAHDMSREYRVLSVLHRAYPPAPRAFLFCEDESVIGAQFLIMERKHGVVVRRAIPERFGGGRDPEANRRISEVLIDALADLHEVDYRAIGLGDLGRPQGFLSRQVRGWAERYARARTRELAVVDEIVRWLEEQLPESPPPALIHNDWRLDNMALDPDDPGRVAAVFDWDMCTVGDPLADLGTLMVSWIEADEVQPGVTGTMPSHVPGFLTRAEAVARYGRRRGVDVNGMPYYYAFGLFKMGVVLQQIYYRYHRGQTHDPRFAPMEEFAVRLFERARDVIRNPRL